MYSPKAISVMNRQMIRRLIDAVKDMIEHLKATEDMVVKYMNEQGVHSIELIEEIIEAALFELNHGV